MNFLTEQGFSNQEQIIMAIFALTVFVSHLLKGRVLIFAMFTLPATILHELSHFIISVITFGKPISFSVLPRKSEKGWTLGSVTSSGSNWINQGLISLAPLTLLVVLYFMWVYRDLSLSYLGNEYVFGYIAANLLVGSIPSTTDLRLAIQAPFIFVLIIALVYMKFFIN